MSKLISVDDFLYKEILKIKEMIKRNGCKNASFSNAIRTMADLPHISTKSRIDKCSKYEREYPSTIINLEKEGKDEKELN